VPSEQLEWFARAAVRAGNAREHCVRVRCGAVKARVAPVSGDWAKRDLPLVPGGCAKRERASVSN